VIFVWYDEYDCIVLMTHQTYTVFWAIGAILVYLSSAGVGSKYGRKFVLAVTNFFSKSIGVEYKMHAETLVIRTWHVPTPGLRGEPGSMSMMGKFFNSLADASAKISAATDPEMQKELRNIGTWKKKDAYSMFYGSFQYCLG